MNVITEEVNYSTMKEKESCPSSSLAEALEKQDLFINSMLTQVVCDILWGCSRRGERCIGVNLETLRVNPIPV